MASPGVTQARAASSARSRLGEAAVLLRSNRRFRRYFVARWVNTVGTTVAPLGLAFGVLAAGGGAVGLGVVLAGGPLVYMLLMPVAGVAGDRLPRNLIIASCHLTSGTAQTVSAVLVLSGHAATWSLASLALLGGAAAAFLKPAMNGLLPQIVEQPGQIMTANAVAQISVNTIALAGPALAGLAIAEFGAGWILAWDAASFFAAAALFASLNLPPVEERTASGFRAELRDGLAAFLERRWLWALSIMSAVSFGTWAVGISVLGPVYARRHLHGPIGWGIVNSALGLGLGIGSVTALLLRPRRVGVIMCATMIPSAMFQASMAAGLPLPVVAAAALATGAASTLQVITWSSFTQTVIPTAQFARVTSLYALVTTVFVPLAYVAAGPLTAFIGVHGALWACVAIELTAGLATVAVPDVRRLTAPAHADLRR